MHSRIKYFFLTLEEEFHISTLSYNKYPLYIMHLLMLSPKGVGGHSWGGGFDIF